MNSNLDTYQFLALLDNIYKKYNQKALYWAQIYNAEILMDLYETVSVLYKSVSILYFEVQEIHKESNHDEMPIHISNVKKVNQAIIALGDIFEKLWYVDANNKNIQKQFFLEFEVLAIDIMKIISVYQVEVFSCSKDIDISQNLYEFLNFLKNYKSSIAKMIKVKFNFIMHQKSIPDVLLFDKALEKLCLQAEERYQLVQKTIAIDAINHCCDDFTGHLLNLLGEKISHNIADNIKEVADSVANASIKYDAGLAFIDFLKIFISLDSFKIFQPLNYQITTYLPEAFFQLEFTTRIEQYKQFPNSVLRLSLDNQELSVNTTKILSEIMPLYYKFLNILELFNANIIKACKKLDADKYNYKGFLADNYSVIEEILYNIFGNVDTYNFIAEFTELWFKHINDNFVSMLNKKPSGKKRSKNNPDIESVIFVKQELDQFLKEFKRFNSFRSLKFIATKLSEYDKVISSNLALTKYYQLISDQAKSIILFYIKHNATPFQLIAQSIINGDLGIAE